MIDQPVYIAPQAIACLGNSVAIHSGTYAGAVVTGDGSVVVGCLVEPVGGVVSVSVNGAAPFTLHAGWLDFYGEDGFVTGDDWDWFSRAFVAGNVLADFDQNGWVNGDDADAFTAAFLEGQEP